MPQVVGGIVSDANPDGIVPGARYAQANLAPVITADIIDHIREKHGPGAKDRDGEFYPEFATAESITLLIQEACANATRIHVGAAKEIDRVVLGATVYFDDEFGTHSLNIGRSARGLKTPSIETNTYVVILDSNNNVITCYPINPADWVYPFEE
ncbi:MAG: hypothetical protein WBF43_06730 [Methylocella sp.]